MTPEGKKKKTGQTGMEANTELRTHRFEMCLSPQEYKQLCGQAIASAENSLAKFARNKLLYGGTIQAEQFKEERMAHKAVLTELARIGNNINQIARALNGDSDITTQMFETLCQVEASFQTLSQRYKA